MDGIAVHFRNFVIIWVWDRKNGIKAITYTVVLSDLILEIQKKNSVWTIPEFGRVLMGLDLFVCFEKKEKKR